MSVSSHSLDEAPELPAAFAGLSLFAFVGTATGRDLSSWCPGRRNAILRRLVRQRGLQPDAIVIDVGSFDGTDAIAFATMSRHSVWTFEPTPSKHASIRERVQRSSVADNVTLFPMALSNYSGEAQLEILYAQKEAGRRFMNNQAGSAQDLLVQAQRPTKLPARSATHLITVPVRELDNLVQPPQRILYMKVDAQGADTLVLRGARQILTQRRIETLAFEFSPFLMPGREREAVAALSWLEGLGYACVPCNGHQSGFDLLEPWPIARYVERFRNTTHYDDIACRPRERLRCIPPPWRAAASGWLSRHSASLRRNRSELDNLVCNITRNMHPSTKRPVKLLGDEAAGESTETTLRQEVQAAVRGHDGRSY